MPSTNNTGPHCLSTSLYLTLNSKQSWLMPLSLCIQHWHLAPPYLYSLFNLSGQSLVLAVTLNWASSPWCTVDWCLTLNAVTFPALYLDSCSFDLLWRLQEDSPMYTDFRTQLSEIYPMQSMRNYVRNLF